MAQNKSRPGEVEEVNFEDFSPKSRTETESREISMLEKPVTAYVE